MNSSRDFSLMGKIGAARLHALYSTYETTKAARTAYFAKFEREVDPDGTLDPAERAVRAQSARKAHMLRMAMKSAQSRKERNGQRQGMEPAPTARTVVEALERFWRSSS